MLFVGFELVFVGWCIVVCCVVCGVLFALCRFGVFCDRFVVVRCLLFGVFCLLFVVCCVLCVVV